VFLPVLIAAVAVASPLSPRAVDAPAQEQRPSQREKLLRDGTIASSVITALGLAATIAGAVLMAGAPSRDACIHTGDEGPVALEDCARRRYGSITLAVGVPVMVVGAVGTGLLAHEWREERRARVRLEARATGIAIRF
jgi:hypothetical protein